MLVAFDQNTVEYRIPFELVIPHTGSKMLTINTAQHYLPVNSKWLQFAGQFHSSIQYHKCFYIGVEDGGRWVTVLQKFPQNCYS